MDIENMPAWLKAHSWAWVSLQIAALALVVYLVNVATQTLLVRGLARLVRSIPSGWGEAFLAQNVISRLAHVVPALVVYHGVTLLSDVPRGLVLVTQSVASAYIVMTLAWSLGNVLNAVGAIYVQRDPERAQARPIKGYLQVAKLVIYLVAAVLVIAVLVNRDPLLLLS